MPLSIQAWACKFPECRRVSDREATIEEHERVSHNRKCVSCGNNTINPHWWGDGPGFTEPYCDRCSDAMKVQQ